MNNINGINITETTNEDSGAYTNTFSFLTTTVKVESKRGVPKLKGILTKHNTIVPTASPFTPWCDGEFFDDIDREDVLDTVGTPIFTTYCEQQTTWQSILNTSGGIFETGLMYAFHIDHQKAVPVDEPVTLQWNLNQTEQREFNTLLFARELREDPRRLGINKPTNQYNANILNYRSQYYSYNCEYRPTGRHYHREGYNCAT
jgi:hypothetical protein